MNELERMAAMGMASLDQSKAAMRDLLMSVHGLRCTVEFQEFLGRVKPADSETMFRELAGAPVTVRALALGMLALGMGCAAELMVPAAEGDEP